MSRNHSLPLKFIEENINENWYWGGSGISENHNLTIDFIKKHIDKKWCWYSISLNSNIKMKDIVRNFDLPWKWDYISLNPNITLQFIEKYFFKLNPNYLAHNSFHYQNYLLQKNKNRCMSLFVLTQLNILPSNMIYLIDSYY